MDFEKAVSLVGSGESSQPQVRFPKRGHGSARLASFGNPKTAGTKELGR